MDYQLTIREFNDVLKAINERISERKSKLNGIGMGHSSHYKQDIERLESARNKIKESYKLTRKSSQNEKMKFKSFDTVIINDNLIGIVICGYMLSDSPAVYIYRILVDATDCCYRVVGNKKDQTKDPEIFREDLKELKWSADCPMIIEEVEDKLKKFEL